MKVDEVSPKIKRLFPWGLFLVLAAVLALGAMVVHARAEDDVWACYGSSRYQAMSSSWPPCTELHSVCDKLRAYLTTHTMAEAYALAAEQHLPKWIIRKAERCLP